ncbi:hypothetical protein EYZ11_008590 [Aspergillus tanneri]|uniref:Ketosynthase family 3 (KS3) domain-containing protein n=1 Tax=Aspergillus tanneri TaxID=1220188 RepID=A0A4S3JAG7_9EURO|nr:hypothetical protein EYZ11_008590 [Aspergillus tanneri]
MALTPDTSNSAATMESNRFIQEPIAVVGMACRLPGHSDSPHKLWEFLMRNGVARTEVPESRFNLKGFYDGTDRPRTMRSPGAMFMETVNPAEFDASFFNISPQEATAMDPQQRILLEVIYEGLESAGISLESIAGENYGCYVGAHTGGRHQMVTRNRPENLRLSQTIGIPDYGCDAGAIKYTHSPTGQCHTFDAKADGYIKAEGINVVILKRLDDAIQDRDPIRAVIRGSANNHNGHTAGIASPSSEVQAAAVRQAYSNANITDYSLTAYLECHGTGTMAGDPVEAKGIASVFAASRAVHRPLHIGSVRKTSRR